MSRAQGSAKWCSARAARPLRRSVLRRGSRSPRRLSSRFIFFFTSRCGKVGWTIRNATTRWAWNFLTNRSHSARCCAHGQKCKYSAMEWIDEGIVLGVKRHGETSIILELMTRAHGRHLGLVRGGAGARLGGILQAGNAVRATWRARVRERLRPFLVAAGK